MTNPTKQKALFLLLVTALITMMLAAALPQLELQKGIPMFASPNGAGGSAPAEAGPPISVNASTFAKIVLDILIFLMVIYLVARLRVRPNWKEIAQVFLAFAAASLMLTALLFALTSGRVTTAPFEAEVLPTEVRQVGPPLAPVPAVITWLVWAGLAGITLLLGLALFRWQRSARRADPLVIEAQQAVQALKAGQDLRSVIIHCYRQMSQILQEEQGLAREETMTAREFETLLETRGVPYPPLSQLTRLFETARYAAVLPGPDAEQQAIDSLNAIIQFCKKR